MCQEICIYRYMSLRIQVCPKKEINPIQSYSREGSGFLGCIDVYAFMHRMTGCKKFTQQKIRIPEVG